MIKSGEKDLEWRDAHITFVCIETGEKLRKEITVSRVHEKGNYRDWNMPQMSVKEFEEMFEDDNVISFALK